MALSHSLSLHLCNFWRHSIAILACSRLAKQSISCKNVDEWSLKWQKHCTTRTPWNPMIAIAQWQILLEKRTWAGGIGRHQEESGEIGRGSGGNREGSEGMGRDQERSGGIGRDQEGSGGDQEGIERDQKESGGIRRDQEGSGGIRRYQEGSGGICRVRDSCHVVRFSSKIVLWS